MVVTNHLGMIIADGCWGGLVLDCDIELPPKRYSLVKLDAVLHRVGQVGRLCAKILPRNIDLEGNKESSKGVKCSEARRWYMGGVSSIHELPCRYITTWTSSSRNTPETWATILYHFLSYLSNFFSTPRILFSTCCPVKSPRAENLSLGFCHSERRWAFSQSDYSVQGGKNDNDNDWYRQKTGVSICRIWC